MAEESASDIEAAAPNGMNNSSNNHTHAPRHIVVEQGDVMDVLPNATAIEDAGCDQAMPPVAAKSMEHKIVWSRKKMVALLLIVVVVLVLGIAIPLTQKKDNTSSQNQAEGNIQIHSDY